MLEGVRNVAKVVERDVEVEEGDPSAAYLLGRLSAYVA